MSNEIDPRVDQWYRHTDKGQQFYVTAIDRKNGDIEVQHFDGDIEEFSLAEWRNLDIELSEEPGNWSGGLDIGNVEDLGTEITDTTAADWEEPLQEIHKPDKEDIDEDTTTDNSEGYMAEETTGKADEVDALSAGTSTLIEQPNGIFREMLNDNWYVEYSEDPDTGLWQANVFKNDVAEWKNTDFESVEEARQAAAEFYEQL